MIILSNKNSKFSVSWLAKDSSSLLIFGLLSYSTIWDKTSFMFEACVLLAYSHKILNVFMTIIVDSLTFHIIS